ncbi:MAG TPA: hypothetical protein VJG32_12120 [Anaerolineae bacterium]|nr:hypothetical protein [Anaerolineae bacterium]
MEDQLVLTYNSLLALKIRVADGVSFFQRERGLWSDANPGVEADAAEVILRSERVTAGCEQVLASLWALIQQLGPSYRDALNC